jgi:hypothetical protein
LVPGGYQSEAPLPDSVIQADRLGVKMRLIIQR